MELEFHQLDLRYAGLRILDTRHTAHLAASLVAVGQTTPVLVVAAADRYVLIDGYCRVAALKQLGRDTVEALVLEQDERAALLLVHRLEHARRRCALEQAWWVRELHEGHRLSLVELARQCRHSVSWVSRRLGLVRALPEPIQEAVRAGRLSPHAAMRVLVPLARANRADALRLVEALAGAETPVSSRAWESLLAAYRRADPEGRERLVRHPLLYLQSCQEATRPDPPEPSLAALVGQLAALAGLARRIRRGLGEVSGAWAQEPALGAAWAEACADVQALMTVFREHTHARSDDAHGDLAPAP